MYKILVTNKFKKDLKKAVRQQKNIKQFEIISKLLEQGKLLPQKNKDHVLIGNWNGYRECHIEPDWLLIYKIDEDNKTIEYSRIGSHSDLFK